MREKCTSCKSTNYLSDFSITVERNHDQGNNKQKKSFLSLLVPKGESVAIMEGKMAPGRHDTVGVSKSLPLIHKHSTERKLTENLVGF